MGFIKALSSPQALTAKVMTGEFRWAVAEGKTIIHQTLPSLSTVSVGPETWPHGREALHCLIWTCNISKSY